MPHAVRARRRLDQPAACRKFPNLQFHSPVRSRSFELQHSEKAYRFLDNAGEIPRIRFVFVFLKNEMVDEKDARISPFDRGFLFGDGIFETILVRNGVPFRWESHMARLQAAAACIRMPVDWNPDQLRIQLSTLAQENGLLKGNCAARITISRGVGARGFSLNGLGPPTILVSLHPIAEIDPQKLTQWRLCLSGIQLPAHSALAHFKTANRLPYVLAKLDADQAGVDEALLTNTNGEITEGSRSNLFWIEQGHVCTPPLEASVLAGITRQVIFDVCARARIPIRESRANRKTLLGAEAVFLTLTTFGVVEATHLDGMTLNRSPLVPQLHKLYWEIVDQELNRK